MPKFIDVPLLCQSMTRRVSNVERQVATPRGRESDHPMATKCSEEIGQCRLTQTAFFDLLYKKSREAYAEKIAVSCTGEVGSFPKNVDFRRILFTFYLFLFTSY